MQPIATLARTVGECEISASSHSNSDVYKDNEACHGRSRTPRWRKVVWTIVYGFETTSDWGVT
jgi:hypothetical protein